MEREIPRAGESNPVRVPKSKYRGCGDDSPFYSPQGACCCLLYVSSQYWQMYTAQRTLAQEWQQQNARPAGNSTSNNDSLVRLTMCKD